MAQLVVNRLPDALTLPLAEVAVDRLMRWKIMGEHLPLTAATLHVEDGIEDFPSVDFSWVPETLRAW